MIEIRYDSSYETPLAIAMGFFDCVHKGHADVIKRAASIARISNAQCAVFTFRNDIGAMFGKKKQIYTYEERLTLFESLGADAVLYADFDADFANMRAYDFLGRLSSGKTVTGVAAGEDYTFGRRAEGDAEFLRGYFASENVTTDIARFITDENRKISSTDIRNAIERGDIKYANERLIEPYFMTGTIVHAHRRGTAMGFPTANLMLSQNRLMPKSGVYITAMTVDGKTYAGGTNVGIKPTFGDEVFSVETFLLDFHGDLYGKTVKLAFYERIRDIFKFGSAEKLQTQLRTDTAKIANFFRQGEINK